MLEVVAALLRQEDRFLICRRPAGKSRALLWEYPGGKTEPGESREEALIRECREELGVTVEVGPVACELTHEYPDLTVHLTLLHAAVREGSITLLEHYDCRFIRPEEIPDYDFCPADRRINELLFPG